MIYLTVITMALLLGLMIAGEAYSDQAGSQEGQWAQDVRELAREARQKRRRGGNPCGRGKYAQCPLRGRRVQNRRQGGENQANKKRLMVAHQVLGER